MKAGSRIVILRGNKRQYMGQVKKMMESGPYSHMVDLPLDAYYDIDNCEINNDWLMEADEDEQISAMAEWFLKRYCDPAEETPYMSSEGGYIWVHGGPYDAQEEIDGQFGDVVSDETREKVVGLLQNDGVFEWAPTFFKYHDYEYDEYLDLVVNDFKEPIERLRVRLLSLKEVMNLQGAEAALEMVRGFIFVGVIAALETFLWETMTYYVDKDDDVVKKIILSHSAIGEGRIQLKDAFNIDRARESVKNYMQGKIVWHRKESVNKMFEHGMGVVGIADNFDKLQAEIQIRHDIVHRSAHTKDGQPVHVTVEDIESISERVGNFAIDVNKMILAIK